MIFEYGFRNTDNWLVSKNPILSKKIREKFADVEKNPQNTCINQKKIRIFGAKLRDNR